MSEPNGVSETTHASAHVFIVDDDPGMRNSTRWLVESLGLPVCTYGTAREFLAEFDSCATGCLILDVRMPDMSGLEVQEELRSRGSKIPIIFVTGYGEVATAVRALKSGALDFVEKPFSDQFLLDRVRAAVEADMSASKKRAEAAERAERLQRLTPRERQVLDLVRAGLPNKAIAVELNISDKTVEYHRANFMKKLRAGSLAELFKLTMSS